jgi:formate-dependent nitrite reductase membrane component NrfD
MEHNWGIPVALDLFFAGLGAGAFMLAVVAQLAGDRKYRAVNIAGALIAPFPAILGVLLLVVDLGRPLRFWEMILRRGEGVLMFNPNSIMSIGTWVLTGFIILSLLYLVVVLFTIPFKWGPFVRGLMGLAGLPFAIMVATYTGVLLSATRSALWQVQFGSSGATLLPMLFVTSALATGVASVIFLLAFCRLFQPGSKAETPVPKLEAANSAVLLFVIVAMGLFLLMGKDVESMKYVVSFGEAGYGELWWIVVVGLGLVIPILTGFMARGRRAFLSLGLATLVLLGGFAMRYVILLAGQMA